MVLLCRHKAYQVTHNETPLTYAGFVLTLFESPSSLSRWAIFDIVYRKTQSTDRLAGVCCTRLTLASVDTQNTLSLFCRPWKSTVPNGCRGGPVWPPWPRSSRGTRAPTRGRPYESLRPNPAGHGVDRSISMCRASARPRADRRGRRVLVLASPGERRSPLQAPRPRSLPAGHGVHRSLFAASLENLLRALRASA